MGRVIAATQAEWPLVRVAPRPVGHGRAERLAWSPCVKLQRDLSVLGVEAFVGSLCGVARESVHGCCPPSALM